MGTDCSIYAKLKDGTYRTRSLDREYVFSQEAWNHRGIFDHVENKKFTTEQEYYQFSVHHCRAWCANRLYVLKGKTEADFNEECVGGDPEYNAHHINQVLDFLRKLAAKVEDVEWLAIFPDSRDFDYEIDRNFTVISI